jgi:hypothetical protein
LPRTPVSPLRKRETFEVLRMAVGDACEHDTLVEIRWLERNKAILLSQIKAVDPDSSTDEDIADRHYQSAQGYRL